MEFMIRSYHPSDLVQLYRICLKTGDSGKDATNIYQDPDVLGHIFVGPYVVLEPDLCFVTAYKGIPYGYILGTRDSQKFHERSEKEWFPLLREKYPLPADEDETRQARIIRMLHAGHKPKPEFSEYPAHLHIDLLPEAQGQGLGRKLTEVFIEKLKELKVPALHLEVGKTNEGAVAFYQKVGYQKIAEFEKSIGYGMKFE